MSVIPTLATEFSLAEWQVENTVGLIDEGNTIPFIARYRKEATGSMDDQDLRTLYERLLYLRNLEERKDQIIRLLTELDTLTDDILNQLKSATTLSEVEDIYRPFRPKRRTRATIAAEKGLQPLADIFWAQELKMPPEEAAAPFINPEKGVETAKNAVDGACDILAELISDLPDCRKWIRDLTWREGFVNASNTKHSESLAVGAKNAGVYDMYFNFSEPVSKIASHRILAINRGEKENWLKMTIEAPIDKILAGLIARLTSDNPHTKPLLEAVIADSYKRLTAPSVEREIRGLLTETAEEGAIKVFAENLRQLLMQSPVKDRVVLAVDPGFRTGCKLAVVDETGKVLETGVVYCTIGKEISAAKRVLKKMIERHKTNIIAIGNGTASRETEKVIADLIQDEGLTAQYIIVNEAGASVYSASKLGAEEFPDFDVSLRSAVSIGRRLQDPLAELVKIDPKSIGVGQYQHDMNQKRLGEVLSGVVESCVNSVGVDLNTASPSLLSYVAGVNPTVARQILIYREENGKFTNRRELLKVSKLGPKAFEQCAGFLRIPGGTNPLDNTGVHPESYKAAEGFLEFAKGSSSEDSSSKDSSSNKMDKMNKNELKEIAEKLSVGLPTLEDIVRELEKPGRDPREDLPPPMLRSDVLSMEDLQEGMILKGTVRNVIDFGAFVDIGVHQDGLVHISELSDKYVKHPLEVVSVGDLVDVRVLQVDITRKRISLSMKV